MPNSFSSTNYCAQIVAVRPWMMFVFISNAIAIYSFTKCEIISYSRWKKKRNQTNGWTYFVCCYTWIFYTLTYLLWLCMALDFLYQKLAVCILFQIIYVACHMCVVALQRCIVNKMLMCLTLKSRDTHYVEWLVSCFICYIKNQIYATHCERVHHANFFVSCVCVCVAKFSALNILVPFLFILLSCASLIHSHK